VFNAEHFRLPFKIGMRFALTPEQNALRETARGFLADRVRVREAIGLPGAHDPEVWKSIAEMGWLGIDVAEEHGGQGLTFIESVLLVEETGRALLPGPFLGTLCAVQTLLTAGTEEQRSARLPALTGGASIVAAATSRGTVRVVRNRVRGEEEAIACATVADVVAVAADTSDGRMPIFVRAKDATIEPRQSADLTRPAARVRFEGARIDERFDPRGLDPVRDRLRVLVAADAVGGAAAALDMAVAYAKDRVQFDRPIGTFQAVKHRAADAWRTLESARLATWYAAWAIANDAPDAHAAALAAKAAAGDAFIRCAADSIQIHGGIGFTWEHDAHLYYRRALADQVMLGDAAAMRDALAADVLAGA
jgi:alkylation response protein AidB-like acyl-CoA dehydrogenase